MSDLAPHLDDAERDILSMNEQVIEHGLGTFMEVGRALARIRDARLYREQHATFEAYCQERWNLSRSRAYRIIDAAGIADALSPMGDIPAPASERQARELSGLSPDAAAEVMRKAHEASDGKVTAAAIRDARNDVAPKPARVTQTTRTTEATKVEHDVDLATGEVLPPADAEPFDYDEPSEPEPAKPRYEPEPLAASAEAKAKRDRLVSNQAWSNNLAANVNWFARLAPAAYRAREFRDQFIPEYAAAHGGVTRGQLLDAARFITALADVWAEDLKESA